MSIDYNEKFLELRKKIAKISERNSEYSQNNNIYKNWLRELEFKTNQRLKNISKNFTSLKDEFISITTKYAFAHSNKNYPSKLFEYSNYKDEEEDNTKNYLKNFSKMISEDINKDIIERQNDINIKFLELENKIRNIFDAKQRPKNVIKNEIVLIANNVKDNIENINMKIEEKRNEEQNIIVNIGESFKKEMDNVNDLINKDNEKTNVNYKNKINEINEWIDNNFKKERKKREMFQKNVLRILKDTCQKLSDDFYGGDNEDELEEEENNNEEENANNEENINNEEGE